MKTKAANNVSYLGLSRSIERLSALTEQLDDIADTKAFRDPDGLLPDMLSCLGAEVEEIIEELKHVKNQSMGVSQ